MTPFRLLSSLGVIFAAWCSLGASAFGTIRSPPSRGVDGRATDAPPPPASAESESTARRAARILPAEPRTNADDPPSTGTGERSGGRRRKPAQLIFPGGGIFFYWQAGAVTHLRDRGFDLSSASMSGASAGALTATLAATGVDFLNATDLALRLAHEAGVWDRPLGLQGVWGPLIERWLDELLPEDAHERANELGLQLLVTPVPSFGKTRVDAFEDRSDLIRANMASIHIPWFLDGKLTTRYRDAEHIDGSFLSKATDYVSKIRPKSVVTLDWTKDPALSSRNLADALEALSKDGIWDLVERGRKYAGVMEKRGDFDSLPRL